jgi:hypothetical protein
MESSNIRVYEEDADRCSIKERIGKCVILLPQANFCLDCHCLHIGAHCPNCCSTSVVRLVELLLDVGDISDESLKSLIDEKIKV